MSADTLLAPPVDVLVPLAEPQRWWLASGLALLATLLAAWLVSDWWRASSAPDVARLAQDQRTELVNRLRLADRVLRSIAADPALRSTGNTRLGNTEKRYFESITLLVPKQAPVGLLGTALPLPDLGPTLLSRLSDGESLLLANRTGAGNVARTILVRRLAGLDNVRTYLVAELASPYLWQGDQPNPNDAAWCLHDGSGNAVRCSSGRASEAYAAMAPATTAQPKAQRWHHGTETWDGVSVNLDLNTPGTDGPWTLLVITPANNTVTGGTPRLVAALGALAALLAATGLAVTARRRIVLQRDRDNTGQPRPSGGPNRARLPTQHMAHMLERQKQVIHAMAEIDRASLSRLHADQLVALAAGHLLQCTGCDVLLLAVLDRDIESSISMVVVPKGAQQIDPQHRQAGPSMNKLLALPPDGTWTHRIDEFELLAPQALGGARSALLLPLYEDGNPVGIISLGFAQANEIGSDESSNARALAGRLGAALTSAARAQALYNYTHFDATTSLPNRQFLKEHLAQQIRQTRRDRGRLALLFVDLDGFKKINAALGHNRADLVLAEAASRMRACVREEDVVTRFGGDEFVIVLPRITEGVDARRVADKLLQALARPFPVGADEHHIGCSIGVSIFPDDAQSVDRILRNADAAMFSAKEAGRGRYMFFDAAVHRAATDQTDMERDLRRALANNEFTVAYQPLVDLVSWHIDGVEALVRWRHPSRGMVPPGEFIALAERCGLIAQIGEFVMRTACQQFSTWELEKIAPQRLSVNVSGLEVARTDIVARVEDVLRATGLRPLHLELELTEGVFLDHTQASIDKLTTLRERGVRIAIDDFGTGYSSLSYLQRLPIDVIKIDQSFVRQIEHNDDSGAIVKAILDVAHSLGKPVVAEGIETEQQRALLATWGCDVGQGYLWSRPLPAAEFGDFCRAWRVAGQPAV